MFLSFAIPVANSVNEPSNSRRYTDYVTPDPGFPVVATLAQKYTVAPFNIPEYTVSPVVVTTPFIEVPSIEAILVVVGVYVDPFFVTL